MEKLLLYHGSANMIGKPEFGKGNPKNDYGLGFYCTEHLELANEWACSDGRDGFANSYELELEGLRIMNLSSGKYHILNWLAILLENRTFLLKGALQNDARNYIIETFLPDYKNYDIIKGYRADDSYFAFASDFINNTISLKQLGWAMHLGMLGEQIVLKSEKAFNQLRFISATVAESAIYYPKKAARDRQARDDFRKERKAANHIEDIYVIDIIRNNWKNDDPRLR